MKITPEIQAALDHPPTPAPFHRKLAHVGDDVYLDGGYVIAVCGPDPTERQRIARSVWALLNREHGNLEP